MSQLTKSMAVGRVAAVDANSQPTTEPENQQLVNLTRWMNPVLVNSTELAELVSKNVFRK
jgi:hypothetical protein